LLGGAGAQERYLVGKARDWIAAHRAEMTLSLRITVAGLIALAIGELLGVRQVYWAVLTAVIVMQASVGGSLKATIGFQSGRENSLLPGRNLPYSEYERYRPRVA
jgi:fatty-acid desaturase